MTTTLPPAGYALKGHQDASWPGCTNCQGHGKITQELRIAGAEGAQGEHCQVCNGVGRVPDPTWPACGCGGRAPAGREGEPAPTPCPVCFGLGLVSPLAAANLANALVAAQAEAEQAQARLDRIQRAAGNPPHARRAPEAS